MFKKLNSIWKNFKERCDTDFSCREIVFHICFTVLILIVGGISQLWLISIVFITIFWLGVQLLESDHKEFLISAAGIIFVIIAYSNNVKDLAKRFEEKDEMVRKYEELLKQQRKAVEIQEKTLEYQFRPWVGRNSLVEVKPDNGRNRIFVKMQFENTGAIPAKNVVVVYKNKVGDEEIPYLDVAKTSTIILPHGKMSYVEDIQFSEDQYKKVLDGQLIWELTVNVSYEGLEANNYITRYSVQYYHKDNKFVILHADVI